jgi:hypothetical protein
MRTKLTLLTAALGLTGVNGANAADAVWGWIAFERQGANVSFTGFAEGDAAEDIRYELSLSKEGRGGRVRNKQGGRVRLTPGTASRLSQSSVNLGEGDDYCVRLALYRGQTIVASYVIQPPNGRSTLCDS